MEELQVEQLKHFKNEITRFMLTYKFALAEMETKLEILQEEFQLLHEYNPIEHTKSRLKSPESILKKLIRKDADISFTSIRKYVTDIAGLRITCSFISDIYRIKDMLKKQREMEIIEVKDYIEKPKPNGYRSLHLLVNLPVFMSDREEKVCVEIQIRTIAMDFWASLEHKIYYKYDQAVPARLTAELKEAADAAAALDRQMERLHLELNDIKESRKNEINSLSQLIINNQQFSIPAALLKLLNDNE